MGNTFSITPLIKKNIIGKDGTVLDFTSGLLGYDNQKLRDEDVVDFLNDDDVNPARVTKICLLFCKHITDKALIAIADTCHNLKWLDIGYCKNITGHGIDAIARKCRKLKTLDARSCNTSHLPEDIGMLLPQLKTLCLDNNPIRRAPASLTRLRS